MLGISEENIIEKVEGEEAIDKNGGIELRYNQTDPTVITDGVDAVRVSQEDEDVYRVDYWGYLIGRLLITEEGVNEMGENLLGDQEEIPRWVIESETDGAVDWIPDDFSPPSEVTCEECHESVAVTEILTPGRTGEGDFERYCRDCWEKERPV